MKILVTGANGFVGVNLTKAMVESGFETHAIVRAASDISLIDKRVHLYRCSTDIELIDYFKKNSFTGVIHLASLFLSNHLSDDISRLIDSNVRFGTLLLEACKLSNVKWFINTGTFWQNYLSEKYNPVNLYAATKEAYEVISKYYTQTSDLIFATLKLNDTYGANDKRNKIINTMLKIAKSGEALNMSQGEQAIDIVHIDDVVEAYILLAGCLGGANGADFGGKTFAVMADKRLTLKNLVKKFEEIREVKLNINWGALEYREREVMNPCGDYELVAGWRQKVSLEDGIKRL